MRKIVTKMPVSIAVELPCWEFTDSDVGGFFTSGTFAPGNADFGSEFSDVFVIFKIGPKFYLGAGFSL